MSFVGGSISQAAAINTQNSRVAAAEAAIATKLEQSVFNSKLALVDTRDAEQDLRLSGLETGKVGMDVYIARLEGVDAKDAVQDARLSAVEEVAASKVAQVAYEAKVALLDAKDAEQEARLLAIEEDIEGRVQDAIDEKVAQGVFDSLATELRDADSALTAALATKVAATTQAAVDSAQNAIITQKADITALNTAVATVNSSLSALDAAKVSKNEFNAKVAALEEFAKLLLKTYTITLPTGATYNYNGSFQNALLAGFQPENPVGLAYNASSKVLSFSLPNTAQQLSFVDININGQFIQRWSPSLTAANRSYFSISGSVISVNLSAFTPTGTITVFTRYDVYSGNGNAGQAQVSA